MPLKSQKTNHSATSDRKLITIFYQSRENNAFQSQFNAKFHIKTTYTSIILHFERLCNRFVFLLPHLFSDNAYLVFLCVLNCIFIFRIIYYFCAFYVKNRYIFSKIPTSKTHTIRHNYTAYMQIFKKNTHKQPEIKTILPYFTILAHFRLKIAYFLIKFKSTFLFSYPPYST